MNPPTKNFHLVAPINLEITGDTIVIGSEDDMYCSSCRDGASYEVGGEMVFVIGVNEARRLLEPNLLKYVLRIFCIV